MDAFLRILNMITIAFEKRFKRIAVGLSLPLIIQSHPWEPFKKSDTIANGHSILLEVLCIIFHCNANGKIVCYKLSELNLTLIVAPYYDSSWGFSSLPISFIQVLLQKRYCVQGTTNVRKTNSTSYLIAISEMHVTSAHHFRTIKSTKNSALLFSLLSSSFNRNSTLKSKHNLRYMASTECVQLNWVCTYLYKWTRERCVYSDPRCTYIRIQRVNELYSSESTVCKNTSYK